MTQIFVVYGFVVCGFGVLHTFFCIVPAPAPTTIFPAPKDHAAVPGRPWLTSRQAVTLNSTTLNPKTMAEAHQQARLEVDDDADDVHK
jgi:hypothetical protein